MTVIKVRMLGNGLSVIVIYNLNLQGSQKNLSKLFNVIK